jgi:uncharacterized protein (DUF1330 family)
MSALRVDRKWLFSRQTNAIDPQRTWTGTDRALKCVFRLLEPKEVHYACLYDFAEHGQRRSAVSEIRASSVAADGPLWRKLAARRAKVVVLEGKHDQRPVSMFEFPDIEAIHAFWNSPDYIPIKKLREGVVSLDVWAFPDA